MGVPPSNNELQRTRPAASRRSLAAELSVGPTLKSREEARALLAAHLAGYRPYPYSRLAELIGSVETADASGADGAKYQLEVEFFWDDKKEGDIRVLGAIDGGSISEFTPMTEAFIKAPDGSFVGE